MDFFENSSLVQEPLSISMAPYSTVLKIHWVSSIFNEAKNLFQGFCIRDDSGITEYRFPLTGIGMYFGSQQRDIDDGSKS